MVGTRIRRRSAQALVMATRDVAVEIARLDLLGSGNPIIAHPRSISAHVTTVNRRLAAK